VPSSVIPADQPSSPDPQQWRQVPADAILNRLAESELGAALVRAAYAELVAAAQAERIAQLEQRNNAAIGEPAGAGTRATSADASRVMVPTDG
jgi:hypothetical protein